MTKIDYNAPDFKKAEAEEIYDSVVKYAQLPPGTGTLKESPFKRFVVELIRAKLQNAFTDGISQGEEGGLEESARLLTALSGRGVAPDKK